MKRRETYTIESELIEKLNRYVELKGGNKSSIVNELIESFLEDKVLEAEVDDTELKAFEELEQMMGRFQALYQSPALMEIRELSDQIDQFLTKKILFPSTGRSGYKLFEAAQVEELPGRLLDVLMLSSKVDQIQDVLVDIDAVLGYIRRQMGFSQLHYVDSSYQLPEYCFYERSTSDSVQPQVVMIMKGRMGYFETPIIGRADDLNAQIGVTPAQAKALVSGSMEGWNSERVNPSYWEEFLSAQSVSTPNFKPLPVQQSGSGPAPKDEGIEEDETDFDDFICMSLKSEPSPEDEEDDLQDLLYRSF